MSDALPARGAATADVTALIELQGLSAPAAPGAPGLALRGLSLRISPGEQVAVIGASGSGKTSLLMALACAVPPQQGQLRLFGQDPWALRSAARQRLRGRLFLAPQVPPLPPRQRVVTAVLAGRLPQMGLWQSLRTLWRPREAGLAHAALDALGVGDKLWQRVDRLSGGERQRVALARALVSGASLWLVDEPLSALDPARADGLIAALCDAATREGRTLVCSLHQLEVARRRFARIVALRGGECVYDGPSSGFDDARVRALYGPAGWVDDAAPRTDEPLATGAPLPAAMCR